MEKLECYIWRIEGGGDPYLCLVRSQDEDLAMVISGSYMRNGAKETVEFAEDMFMGDADSVLGGGVLSRRRDTNVYDWRSPKGLEPLPYDLLKAFDLENALQDAGMGSIDRIVFHKKPHTPEVWQGFLDRLHNGHP